MNFVLTLLALITTLTVGSRMEDLSEQIEPALGDVPAEVAIAEPPPEPEAVDVVAPDAPVNPNEPQGAAEPAGAATPGGNSVAKGGAGAKPVGPSTPSTPAGGGRVAEDQTPTGAYTTASEVKMILDATKGSWIAVRPYEGQDLLYFTNLLAWRCGTFEIQYAVNDEPMQVLEMEPCYTDEAAPNALKIEDILPYVTFPEQSVQTIKVHVLFDDLSETDVTYNRAQVQIN